MRHSDIQRLTVGCAVWSLVIFGGGCCWTDKNGHHQLIVGLGLGIVTTTNRPGLDVWDDHVLGAEVGPNGVGVGWMGHHQVVIDPVLASNLVVSIQTGASGLTVKNFDPYSQNTNFNQPKAVSNTNAKP